MLTETQYAVDRIFNPYRLSGEWGAWLSGMPWVHFFTGTFRQPRSSVESIHRSMRVVRRAVQRVTGDRPQIISVVEGIGSFKRMHLHALVGWDVGFSSRGRKSLPTPSRLQARALWDEWNSRYGRAHAGRITGRGSAYYVAKYMTKERGSFALLIDDGWPGNT